VTKLRVVVACACVLSLIALAAFVREHSYSMYDDAFIYLRYVKNVRAGCGLRFNCSEPPVEGFSSPLWLLLLVAGSKVTRKLVTVTQVFGTASIAGLLVAAPIVAAQHHGDRSASVLRRGAAALIVAALLLFDHYALLNAVIGLESGLAALAVLLAFGAVSAERHKTAIALSLAMVLVRPEGIVFVLALFVLPWARTRRVSAACGLAIVLVVLLRWSVFGDVVPNTAWAKAGGTARHLELGLGYAGKVIDDFPAVVLAPLALAWRPARDHASYLLLASLLWMLGVVYAGGDTFEYSRLAFPLVPTLSVCGVQGVLALASRWPVVRRRRLAVHGATLVCALLAARAARLHALAPQHRFENVELWTVTGQYLKAHHPKARIATVPIGAIGYFSELEVLDLVGLTSPAIARAGRSVPPALLTPMWIGHERNNLEYALKWAPDLVITTKVGVSAWTSLDEASAGFYADWLILDAMKRGVAPYHVQDLEVLLGIHVLAFARDDATRP
jgi:arabinofuranosyltransferase